MYKISELADKAGVTKRTIHYYISKGLLFPSEGSGVNSLYNDNHIKRLNLIKKLQAQYMPLEKIRDYIMHNPDGSNNVEICEKLETGDNKNNSNLYVREDVCNIFEIHCSKENAEKYKYIINNVKDYVKKMMED